MSGDVSDATRPPSPLDAVRRRLELAVAAIAGHAYTIEDAPPPAPPPPLARLLRRAPAAGSDAHRAMPSTDGTVLRLPAEPFTGGPIDPVTAWRALAAVQAERARRGAAAHAPGAAGDGDRRDARDDATRRAAWTLYDAWDGGAALRAVRRAAPGLGPALDALVAHALRARPPVERLTPAERAVERRLRDRLAACASAAVVGDDAMPPDDAPPAVVRDWALAVARECTAARARMRGLAPVFAWGAPAAWRGDVTDASRPVPPRAGEGRTLPPARLVAPPDARGRRVRRSRNDETPHRRVGAPDPRDADTPDALDDPRGRALADDRGTGAAARGADGGGPARAGLRDGERDAGMRAHEYPEWDARTRTLVAGAARVLVPPADWRGDGGAAWAARALAHDAGLVRATRAHFERLRPRRERLAAQRDGTELDLDAVVRAAADRRAGCTPDDAQWVAIRPARRAIAIAVLVDASGSTGAFVAGDVQVIDVARRAALLAAEALDALGDPFALLAFSSLGRRHVEVDVLKGFREGHGPRVRTRIGALAPGGNTRLGAALRHAGTLLAAEPAGHRLLLVVTDGRPHDTDDYVGAAALADARHAVLAVRAQGVVPYCLAIGDEEPDYLATLFGAGRYAMLRDARRLPGALVRAAGTLVAPR